MGFSEVGLVMEAARTMESGMKLIMPNPEIWSCVKESSADNTVTWMELSKEPEIPVAWLLPLQHENEIWCDSQSIEGLWLCCWSQSMLRIRSQFISMTLNDLYSQWSNQNGISEGPSWQQVLVCKWITNKWRLSSTINESMSTDWCLIWEFKGNWNNGMRGDFQRIGTGIEWDGNRCLGWLHRM